MSLTLIRAFLQQRSTSLLWFSIGLAIYSWFAVWYFPQIAANEELFEQIQDTFGEEMMAAFGAAELELSTLGGFVGVEYLSLMWVIIVGSAIILVASKAIASDVEMGTMEVTLTQPVSRLNVAASRYLAMVVYAVVINLATVVPIVLAAEAYEVQYDNEAMVLLFLAGLLVTLVIGGFAFAVSSFSTGGGRVAAVAGGLLGAMWLANFVANVNDSTEFLGKLTLFHYWRPDKIIDEAIVAPEAWWVFGIAAVVFPLVAFWWFTRRDVAA